MAKKQILKLVSFLLIVAVLLSGLCGMFEYENSHMTERLETYKELEQDTVDAVYVGTSGVHCFWVTPKAYEDYGLTVYPLTSDAMPSWVVKNMVVEALKYQNPKLVIVDLRCFAFDPTEDPDAADKRSRRVIDMLDSFSLNRIDAIRNSLSVLNDVSDDVDDLSFYLPFIKYHDLWSSDDFSFDELGVDKGSDSFGYKMVKSRVFQVKYLDDSEYTTESKLDKYSTKYLNELIDYFEQEDINYLFVAEPRYLTEEKYALYNGIFDILDERNAPYVDYVSVDGFEKSGLNRKGDFYDPGHTNFEGAKKYTDTFSKYLVDNYDFPDRRTDENCYQWNGVWDHVNDKINKWK